MSSGRGQSRQLPANTKRAMLTSALDDGDDASPLALKSESSWPPTGLWPPIEAARRFLSRRIQTGSLARGANWPPVKRTSSVHLHGSLAGTHFRARAQVGL